VEVNRSGKCEGLGGGGSMGCIMHRVHTSKSKIEKQENNLFSALEVGL
jgi:hypothetical protein